MPHVDIRPARPEEMAEFARQGSRQLGLPEAMLAGMNPDWTMAAFVDGVLATTYAFWPLQLRLAGRAVKLAGVTQVSTHPAYRRQGLLRAVTQAHFAQMHARREVAFAGLHPAQVAIYQRYGYGSATVRQVFRIAPRDIAFHHKLPLPGRVREVDPDREFALLVEVYRRFREDRTAMVHRGRAMWLAGALQDPPAGQRQVVLAYEEDGQALGSIVYVHGQRRLRVMDHFALVPAATQALWGALASYDNVDEILWDNAPPDDPLPLMLAEPRALHASQRDGIMVRLVTVEDAMAQRPYAAASELRFGLVDAFCPWNAGQWRVATSPEGGQASRIDGQAVDFTLTPDTLAALVFGRCTARQAARAGLLAELRDEAALARWDEVLRLPHAPYEAEHTW